MTFPGADSCRDKDFFFFFLERSCPGSACGETFTITESLAPAALAVEAYKHGSKTLHESPVRRLSCTFKAFLNVISPHPSDYLFFSPCSAQQPPKFLRGRLRGTCLLRQMTPLASGGNLSKRQVWSMGSERREVFRPAAEFISARGGKHAGAFSGCCLWRNSHRGVSGNFCLCTLFV